MFKKESNAKKGEVVGDALDLLSILFTVLVILLFLHLTFTSSGEAKAQQVAVSLAQSYAQQELLVLLQTPITVESQEITLSDGILLWYHQRDRYGSLFTAEVQKLLEPEKCASLSIEPEGSSGIQIVNPLVISSQGRLCQLVTKYTSASLTFPNERLRVTYQYPVRP